MTSRLTRSEVVVDPHTSSVKDAAGSEESVHVLVMLSWVALVASSVGAVGAAVAVEAVGSGE